MSVEEDSDTAKYFRSQIQDEKTKELFNTFIQDILRQGIERVMPNIEETIRDVVSEVENLKESVSELTKGKEDGDISLIFASPKKTEASRKSAERRQTIVGMVGAQVKPPERSGSNSPVLPARSATNFTVMQNPTSNFPGWIRHIKSTGGIWEILIFLRAFHQWTCDDHNVPIKIITRMEREAINTLLGRYRNLQESDLFAKTNEEILHMIYATVAPKDKFDCIRVLRQVKFKSESFTATSMHLWCDAYDFYVRDFLEVMEICIAPGELSVLPTMKKQPDGLINIFLDNIVPSDLAWKIHDNDMEGKKFTDAKVFIAEFTAQVNLIREQGKIATTLNKRLASGAVSQRDAKYYTTPVTKPTPYSKERTSYVPFAAKKKEYENQRHVHGLSHVTALEVDDSTIIERDIQEQYNEAVRDPESENEDEEETLERSSAFFTPTEGIQLVNYTSGGKGQSYGKPQQQALATQDRLKTMPCFNLMKTKECKTPKCNFSHDHVFIGERVKEMYLLWFPNEAAVLKHNPKA
jgi:hypothetical protein